jgi:hypothetical protein
MARLNTISKLEKTSLKKCIPSVFKKKKLQADMLQTANSIPRIQVVSVNKSLQKNHDCGSASFNADQDPDPAFFSLRY